MPTILRRVPVDPPAEKPTQSLEEFWGDPVNQEAHKGATDASLKSIERDIVAAIASELSLLSGPGDDAEQIAWVIFGAIERGDIPHVRIEY